MSRKDLQTHLQEKCHYRPYECEHCGHKDTFRAITKGELWCSSHYSECLEYPLACPNKCGVTGIKRRAVSDHRSSCPLEPLNCPFKGCWERVSRKDLQTHLQEECYYRPYECEHCGHKDTYMAITGEDEYMKGCLHYGGHYSECPEYPLDCPNECGVTGIKRRAMPDHHSSCPLEPVDCLFKDAGCTEKIARKNTESHMTANQQKHMLLTFHSLQQSNQQLKQDLQEQMERGQQELHLLKDDMRREIESLEESIRRKTNTPKSTAQALCHMKSIMQMNLDEIGDTLTFRVTDFPQLMKGKKGWYSPPFSIGDKVRVRLAVYPSGIGRGQGSHVSVSLILTEVVEKEEHIYLEYNVSVAARGQHISTTHKILELCTPRAEDNSGYVVPPQPPCSARFPFPSPGEVLRSEELFLEVEHANCLIVNDSVILGLKLLKHRCHYT